MRKVVKLAEAVGRMPDGVVLMIGGFMGASRDRMKIRVESSHKADRVPGHPEKVQPHP